MEWLNYHHLHYFWMVVREGGIAAASRKLHVGRASISMQLKSLETFVGTPLFERRGRYLELTDTGRLVHGYAEDIFRTGGELVDAVRGRPAGKPMTLRVGIADVMAKLVAFRLLLPALDFDEELALECREDDPQRLFAELAVHELDLVLSDIALNPGIDVRAYNHLMGESTITLFATPKLARRLARGFPESLSGQPFLMPSRNAAIRRSLEIWMEDRGLHPVIVAEFEDSALLKVFGQAGRGVFPAPTVVADKVRTQYGVRASAKSTASANASTPSPPNAGSNTPQWRTSSNRPRASSSAAEARRARSSGARVGAGARASRGFGDALGDLDGDRAVEGRGQDALGGRFAHGVGDGFDGGELHGGREARGAGLEGAAEEAGEGEHVVDLVREVAAPRSHDLGAAGARLRRGMISGVGVRHGEHDRVGVHRGGCPRGLEQAPPWLTPMNASAPRRASLERCPALRRDSCLARAAPSRTRSARRCPGAR